MQPLPYEYLLKIAHYFKLYLGLSDRQAHEFVSIQRREGLIEHKLPFGLFWCNNGKWYVTPYSVGDPGVMMIMVNVKLASLKIRCDEGRPAWIVPPAELTA